MMKFRTFVMLAFMLCISAGSLLAQRYAPKREFRGAWIQCVNGQFQGMPVAKMKQTLISQLDNLKGAGMNAIIFQVRAEADALYRSAYEPWSRFLTGVQGKAPSPVWDPLEFMVEECHKRGMELHAWINPYRAKPREQLLCLPCILIINTLNCLSLMPDSYISIPDCRNHVNIFARLYAIS